MVALARSRVEPFGCRDALDRLGLFATTAPGGAGTWRDEHTLALRGATVLPIADCDTPCRTHALQVASELYLAGVKVLDPLDPSPFHQDGFDIVDHLAGVADTIRAVTPEIGAAEIRSRLRDHLDGLFAHQLPADNGAFEQRLERSLRGRPGRARDPCTS